MLEYSSCKLHNYDESERRRRILALLFVIICNHRLNDFFFSILLLLLLLLPLIGTNLPEHKLSLSTGERSGDQVLRGVCCWAPIIWSIIIIILHVSWAHESEHTNHTCCIDRPPERSQSTGHMLQRISVCPDPLMLIYQHEIQDKTYRRCRVGLSAFH